MMETKTLDMDKLARVNHLAGELGLLAARLGAARVRIFTAAMLLAVILPLEWAFGMDLFAEFARDDMGRLEGVDLALVVLKGLMLLSAVVILKYALQPLGPKARAWLFWAAGLVTVAMLLGVGLARNDLMHIKHLEMTGAGTEISQDAELAALGLAAFPPSAPRAVPVEVKQAEIEQSLMGHTAFLAVAYVLISLGSAICLVELIEQWPKLVMLRWTKGQLAKIKRLRGLQEEANRAALAASTLAENRMVLLRASQDLIIRTHLDGLSYTPWWRNSFRHFHLHDASKINKAQAYAMRWLRFINTEPAREDIEACHKALEKLNLVQPSYPEAIVITPDKKEARHV